MSGRPEIVEAARGWLGTPYRHQGSVRGAGADCLGLVRGVWREVLGREPEVPPAYTPDWGEATGEETLLAGAIRNLIPAKGTIALGDVLLFRMRAGRIAKHVGIASAPDRFIHAYAGHGVVESALTDPWARRVVARFRFPERTD